jgi:tetratricopeptide (TPR) repeat protein
VVVEAQSRSPLSWPPALPATRTLVIAGAAIGLLALAALGGWAWHDAGQRSMASAYGEVMARVQTAEASDATAETKAAAARDLEAVLARYPSARMVPQAAYELGNLRLGARQYPAARTAYELALQRGASGMVRTLSRSGIARSWEDERDFAKAAEAYAALVADLEPRSFLYEEALLNHARALELSGKRTEAVAAYQKVLKDVPNARRADDIRTRLASLGIAAR